MDCENRVPACPDVVEIAASGEGVCDMGIVLEEEDGALYLRDRDGYLIWGTYALALNTSVWLRNRDRAVPAE
ncbi:hypothetical protein EV663_12214 [Rhodovulum bhavnagarense]|uniref:Uncharacterized protein n=1 Tax=Rhodovulum bhavnagarense TaxID=992286 RepID=A0A4R2R919_9RHOB|nr:hypothetical protein EV663_12214 [Rhodovulum bhavnagarense]